MGENTIHNYFPAVKFICMLFISAYIVANGQPDSLQLSSQVCLFAFVLILAAAYETCPVFKWVFLLAEGVLLVLLYLFFTPNCCYLLPFLVLDGIVYRKGSVPWLLLPMLGGIGLFPCGDRFFYLFCCLFAAIFYLQNYFLIGHYRKNMENYEREEYELKDAIDSHELRRKEELRANGLYYEKMMLEDKARLTQMLHDKLGHSINGTVYQLEACRVLFDKDREKCLSILQNVIDSLRGSMDEIRMILRKEKPDRKQMALVQLHALGEECREKYEIDMELSVKGDTERISGRLWEVLLDNTFEAVTNSLKYSGCKHIRVEILVMNKLVRCNICDDGKGCGSFETGMGTEGMKQRVRKLGGTIDFEAVNGFAVNMILPIEAE